MHPPSLGEHSPGARTPLADEAEVEFQLHSPAQLGAPVQRTPGQMQEVSQTPATHSMPTQQHRAKLPGGHLVTAGGPWKSPPTSLSYSFMSIKTIVDDTFLALRVLKNVPAPHVSDPVLL